MKRLKDSPAGSRIATVHNGSALFTGNAGGGASNIARDPVSVHDLHATLLHLLGLDFQRFSFRSQGLDQKLTGVEPASVIRQILA